MHYTGVPNYLEIITEPMDLGTIKKGMVSQKYESHEQWADDIRKVWSNAMHFNAAGNHLACRLFPAPPLPRLCFRLVRWNILRRRQLLLLMWRQQRAIEIL